MFTFRGSLFIYIIDLMSILLIGFQSSSTSLQIRASISPRAHANCKEVLSKNLECPSIGSYPVAGACDYFARCIQTENGVDSEVDFCPDGHIYVVNRCIKSHNLDDCPQKGCALVAQSISEPITTPKTIFPIISAGNAPKPRPNPGTKRPLLNLHPILNGAPCNNPCKRFYHVLLSTLFASIILITNKLL